MEKNEPIPVDKLPLDQFKMLGMEKKDVLALPEPTMKALLSGNRTSLIQFNNLKINGIAEPVTINAKLSLQKTGDRYELKMHPVNQSLNNNIDLSKNEIEHLKKDPLNVVPKMVVGKDGKLHDSFISLDNVTNEFVAVKREHIKSPDSINDINLTDAQKKDFANGRPIQIGKENYQMDLNSEQGISGDNLKKIKFQSGEYNSYNLLADAALIISGLGVLVLLEHLARSVFNNVYGNRQPIHELLKQDLKPAIKRTVATIAEKAANGAEMNAKEKNELFVVNLKDTTNLEKTVQVTNNPTIDAKNEIAQKFTYEGKLTGHGQAPYEFKKENKDNYFVKLETDKGEKTVWGADLARSIPVSNAKVGDIIGIDFKGQQPVTVAIDRKDEKGQVVGQEEKSVQRNAWSVEKIDGIKNNIQVAGNNGRTMNENIKDGLPQAPKINLTEVEAKPLQATNGPTKIENNPVQTNQTNSTAEKPQNAVAPEKPKAVEVIRFNDEQKKQLFHYTWERRGGDVEWNKHQPELTPEQLRAIPDRIDDFQLTKQDKFALLYGATLGDLEKGATYSLIPETNKIERFSLIDEVNLTHKKNGVVLEKDVHYDTPKADLSEKMERPQKGQTKEPENDVIYGPQKIAEEQNMGKPQLQNKPKEPESDIIYDWAKPKLAQNAPAQQSGQSNTNEAALERMAAEKAGFVISTDKNGEKIFLVKETEIGTGKDLTLESQQNKNTINRNEGKLQVDQGVAKAKIEKAKADISNQKEVGTKASDAATNDHQKIMHPEQRQPGETKPSLQKDENSQTNKAANAASEIKKDVKEIVEVKSRMRR